MLEYNHLSMSLFQKFFYKTVYVKDTLESTPALGWWQWTKSSVISFCVMFPSRLFCQSAEPEMMWATFILAAIPVSFPNMEICMHFTKNVMMTSSNGNIFHVYWPFARGIHRSPVDSPHKGQWSGALMVYFICTWTNGWANNQDAADLRYHHTHFDVTVMYIATYSHTHTYIYIYTTNMHMVWLCLVVLWLWHYL